MQTATLTPPVTQPWPDHGGIYAGIAAPEPDQPERHVVLLTDKPPKAMTFKQATEWAASLGNGARLPTRFEAALIYANLRDKIEEKSDWYWTSTPNSDGNVWVQHFYGGGQGTYPRYAKLLAVAVRCIPVSPSTL